jgi:hypothetical protein
MRSGRGKERTRGKKTWVLRKKKIKYTVYDLLKIGHLNKEKLKRIRAICDG